MEEKRKQPLIRLSELTKYELDRIQAESGLETYNATVLQLIHEHKTIPLLKAVYGTV